MVAPTLASDHPGLEILAEIAKVLAAGRPADEGLPGVVGVLRRGLALRRCRLWLRSADGSRFLPIVSPEEETQLPGFTSAVADWVAEGPHRESVAGGTLLRLPLMHENQALGCFDVIIPQDPHERVAHDVLVVVAQMLAPVLAAHELSQDLETGMVGGQRRRDHKVANLGMPLPARQRRLTTEREQTPQNRPSTAEKGGGANHNTEMRGGAAAHAERGEHGDPEPAGAQRHR